MAETRDKQPLVAVVTPVYNGLPYLEKTLACVQAQTHPNLVHVVLDNASTDNTPQVIAQARGGRVPILTRRNASVLPQVENWNAAIAMTPAEAGYIKFLCADDLIRADAVARMVAIAEAHPRVQFVTAIDVFDDLVKPHNFDQEDRVYDGRECVRRLVSGDITWFPFPHLFFRVTPERLENPFNPAASPAQDADFVFRLLLEGDMGFVNEALFYTRKHESAATSRMGGDRLFIVTGLRRLRLYGRNVLAPDEFERRSRNAMRLLLRHILAWRASGKSELAAQTMQALVELGLEPGLTDYVAAILSWPRHKLLKTARQMTHRVSEPPIRMTAVDFLVSSQGMPVPER
ncbi:MAG: glycosyltransferase family 2 protein [Rhodomicrobiaceae bacterium]